MESPRAGVVDLLDELESGSSASAARRKKSSAASGGKGDETLDLDIRW